VLRHVRIEAVALLVVGGLTGVWFAITRGFWPASPLLVIASVGLALHLLPPIPRDQPGLSWWLGVNLLGLVMALAATWVQSPGLLLTGMLLVGIAIAMTSLQRTS
jgi:hypothetical protein